MKLFYKSKENKFNCIIKKLSEDVLSLYLKEMDLSFEQITELERQILATYLFGMFDGVRQNNHFDITPNQIAIDISDILISVFRYSKSQAESFIDEKIEDLQSSNPQNTSYAIIHRGLEGYFIWSESREKVIQDIIQIVNLLKR